MSTGTLASEFVVADVATYQHTRRTSLTVSSSPPPPRNPLRDRQTCDCDSPRCVRTSALRSGPCAYCRANQVHQRAVGPSEKKSGSAVDRGALSRLEATRLYIQLRSLRGQYGINQRSSCSLARVLAVPLREEDAWARFAARATPIQPELRMWVPFIADFPFFTSVDNRA